MAKQSMTQTVGEVLRDLARSTLEPEPTITHGDLVALVGLPPITGPGWDNHPLTRYTGSSTGRRSLTFTA